MKRNLSREQSKISNETTACPPEERQANAFEVVLANAVHDLYNEAELYGSPDYEEESFTDVPTADILTTVSSRLVFDSGVCSGEVYVARAGEGDVGVESIVRDPNETTWFGDRGNGIRALSNADLLRYIQTLTQTPVTQPESPQSNRPELGEADTVTAINEALSANRSPDYSVRTFVAKTPFIENGLIQEEDDVTIGRMQTKSEDFHFIDIPISADAGTAKFLRHPGSAEKSKGYGSFDVTKPDAKSLTVHLRIEFPSDGSAPIYQSYYHDTTGQLVNIGLDEGVINQKYVLDALRRFADNKLAFYIKPKLKLRRLK